MGSIGVAEQREEVVPVEGDVDTDVFAPAHGIADIAVVRGVLWLQLNADTQRSIGMYG